jgi:hypothetical protein
MEWNDKNVQIITSVNIDFLPSGHNTGRNRYLPVQTSNLLPSTVDLPILRTFYLEQVQANLLMSHLTS